MPRTRFYSLYCTLIISFFSFQSSAQVRDTIGTHPKKPGQYYVMAPSGLNLRSSSEPGSSKLATLPQGTVVKLEVSAEGDPLNVDGIRGGMARISTDKQSGYAFEGYLSRYPPPRPDQQAEAYADFARSTGNTVLYESHRRDWGGYIQEEEAVNLPGVSWEAAFLIARQLFSIPPGFSFPDHSDKQKLTIVNPQKPEVAWTDEMTVIRDEDGKLKEISYSYRGEATGSYVAIKYNSEERGLRISQVLIAD